MAYRFLDIASTPSVPAARATNRSREVWGRFSRNQMFERLTENEAEFSGARDSCYMAATSKTGLATVRRRGEVCCLGRGRCVLQSGGRSVVSTRPSGC